MKEDLVNFTKYHQTGGNLLLKPTVVPHKRLNLDLHLANRVKETQHNGMFISVL